jgi:hypothetical protein
MENLMTNSQAALPVSTPSSLKDRVVRAAWKAGLGAVLVLIGGGALWFWGSLTYVYSSGERAGYIQKISRKGWVIKTWEGELAMVNIPGAMQEKFYFTVRNKAVAQEIQKAVGQRVVLTYEEHRGLPGRLFGDTPYFVTKIQSVSTDTPRP